MLIFFRQTIVIKKKKYPKFFLSLLFCQFQVSNYSTNYLLKKKTNYIINKDNRVNKLIHQKK